MVDQFIQGSFGGRPLVLNDPDKYPEARGLANGLFVPLGPDPSVGWLLLFKSDLDALIALGNIGHQLIFKAGGELDCPALWIVSASQVWGGVASDPNSVYLVKVADKRWHARLSSVNRTYNVRCPAPAALSGADLYYPGSLNSGSLWTWGGLVGDLWALAPILGAFTSLPLTPSTTPEGFKFYGQNVLACLSGPLQDISCDISYAPTTDTVSIVPTGATQTGLAALLAANAKYLRDAGPVDVLGALGAYSVAVYFRRVDVHYGTEPATENTTANWANSAVVVRTVSTGIAGAVVGTVETIYDDLPALINFDGTEANGSAMDSKAAARAAQYVAEIQISARRRRQLFQGIIPDFVPGSEVKAVHWRNFGDGWVTELINAPGLPARADTARGMDFEAAAGGGIAASGELLAPPDLARQSFPVYPPVLQMVTIAGGTDGALVGASADNLFAAYVTRTNPAAAFSGDTPYVTNEPCLVAVVNLLTGSKFTNCRLAQGERYFARLSGTATAGGDDLPLYLLHRPENFVEHVTIPAPGVAAHGSISITLPDGRTVTVTNQTETTFATGDYATAYYDWTAAAWYVTGGGSGTTPDNMAVVRGTSANANGNCFWPGVVLTPNSPITGVCSGAFTDGADCFLVILNQYTGSVSSSPISLDTSEPYIARFLGDFDNGDDTTTPIYAIRPENNEVFAVTIPSPGVAHGAAISITLADGRSVSATNHSTSVDMATDDLALLWHDLEAPGWFLIKSGGASSGSSGTAIVKAYGASANGDGLWAGKTSTPSNGTDYTSSQFPDTADCWIAVLNVLDGSAATIKTATLDVGEPYLGQLVGSISGVDVYAIRVEQQRVFVGKTNGSVSSNSGSSNNVSIYTGTPGSETDSGVDLTAYNRTSVSIGSGKWVKCTYIPGNGWYLEPWEC